MMSALAANLRRLRFLVWTLRRRGYGPGSVLLLHLPAVFLLRAYGKFARAFNAAVLCPWLGDRRLARFQAEHAARPGGHFYVIVMPRTLHFLLPCLALLPKELPVFLVANGAARWERQLLRQRFPHLPQVVLATLPGSSVMHGDVLSLLLRHNAQDFGILDHDLYVFDPSVFSGLHPADNQYAIALFPERNDSAGLTYPETYFLYFHARPLKALMQQYGIDARLYRHPPPGTEAVLASLGLGRGRFLKPYQKFFDTLGVLFALAMAQGLEASFPRPPGEDAVSHIGGTSMGNYRTKSLPELYLHRSFLDLVNLPDLTRRYARLTAPFSRARDIRRRLRPGTEEATIADEADRLIERLRSLGVAQRLRADSR